MGNADDVARLDAVLGEGVLSGTATRVLVDGQARHGTKARAFIASLKGRPQLHFA